MFSHTHSVSIEFLTSADFDRPDTTTTRTPDDRANPRTSDFLRPDPATLAVFTSRRHQHPSEHAVYPKFCRRTSGRSGLYSTTSLSRQRGLADHPHPPAFSSAVVVCDSERPEYTPREPPSVDIAGEECVFRDTADEAKDEVLGRVDHVCAPPPRNRSSSNRTRASASLSRLPFRPRIANARLASRRRTPSVSALAASGVLLYDTFAL